MTALEKSLGYALFQRTTRTVAPTDEAKQLHERLIGSIRGLEEVLEAAADRKEAISGPIRITTTADVGRAVLPELVAKFTARHPQVTVEVILSTRAVDLLKLRFDFALRVAGNRLAPSGLIVRKVGTITLDLYATPRYLARKGRPRTPSDLAHHELVHFENWLRLKLLVQKPKGNDPTIQEIQIANQRLTKGSITSRIISDDMAFIHETVLRDAGIAVLPRFLAGPDVERGALERVLPNWSTVTGNLLLLQPSRQQVPARVKLFRQALLEQLQSWPG